jgi:hypothetical protein
MHCLPPHRGNEVTDKVIDGEHFSRWQEAGNRLPTEEASNTAGQGQGLRLDRRSRGCRSESQLDESCD